MTTGPWELPHQFRGPVYFFYTIFLYLHSADYARCGVSLPTRKQGGLWGDHEAELNVRSHRPIRHVFIFHTHRLLSRQTLVGTQVHASTYGSCTSWHERTYRPAHMLQAGHTGLHKLTSKGRRQLWPHGCIYTESHNK